MSFDIIEKLKKEISGYKSSSEWEDVGRVTEVGDGIAKITGLSNALSQELLTIETSSGEERAVVLNLEEETIGALILGKGEAVKSGDVVKGTGKVLSIDVGEELLGRVVDPLGVPQDGRGPIFEKSSSSVNRQLENNAPSVLDREPVNTPLHTGVKPVDSMIPIGRGQRELIIGDRQTGKTALALDTIINQRQASSVKGQGSSVIGPAAAKALAGEHRPVVCIYVAIGQKESKVAKIVETLKKFDAMKYTVVISASASTPAALWYLAPFAGCAIGEYFRDKGEDALVIYDDLSKHAWAYRQISLLLRRPPGREAYPGDVFYLHSRLLERAAKLSKEKGGGSLTALPIIETQLGDVTAYIPTNVISITDGQIYLESDLFYQGVRPAVNVGLSVSRVGSAAQTKAMKKVAGQLRLQLAQFRELQAFVQFASDVDDATKKRIKQGQIITEMLKQDDLAPLPLEEQVVIFYAVLNNYFENLDPAAAKKTEAEFLEYMRKLHGEDVLNPIMTKGELAAEVEEKLKSAISQFMEFLHAKIARSTTNT